MKNSLRLVEQLVNTDGAIGIKTTGDLIKVLSELPADTPLIEPTSINNFRTGGKGSVVAVSLNQDGLPI